MVKMHTLTCILCESCELCGATELCVFRCVASAAHFFIGEIRMRNVLNNISDATSKELEKAISDKFGDKTNDLYFKLFELLNEVDYKEYEEEFACLHEEFLEYQRQRDLYCYQIGSLTAAEILKKSD